jgi:uncharacterized protein (TIGR02145 family)
MKKIYTLIAALFLFAFVCFTKQATAQTSQKMSYQSVIRNSNNNLLTNTLVGTRISVLQESATGAGVYVETQTATTNSNGLLSLKIGAGTAVTGTFAGIDWAAGPYFIKTETDPTGGSNYTITNIQELMFVPYALNAKIAAKSSNDASQTAAITAMQAQIRALEAENPTGYIIGTQTWQNNNLDVSNYRDGTPIPQVTDPTAWAGLTTGAWCYYNNDAANGTTYGKLYNWYAVVGIHDNDPTTPNKVLAPTGWHIATDAELTTLTTFLGGSTVAGGTMKEAGTAHWTSPNTAATNSSGFTALPGGVRYYDGPFLNLGKYSFLWSSTEHNITLSYAWYRNLNYDNGNISRSGSFKQNGFSVRCLRD